MEETNQKSIDVLNNLLEINNDRIEGYNHAIKETDQADLKGLFAHLSATSHTCKQELIAEVQKLGGTPIEGTKATGKLYRVWMDVKAALTNKDRVAILNSCEFGEDVAVKNYEDSLKNYTMGSEIFTLITKQYNAIKADHDKIKSIRDLVKA